MNDIKWKCSVCTYENWPAAAKCVICHTAKPSLRIEDEIYKLAITSTADPSYSPITTQPTPIESGSPPPTVSGPSQTNTSMPPPPSVTPVQSTHSGTDVRPKWSCPACTYLNWPKARKCIQCRTPRSRRASPTLGAQSSPPSIVSDPSHSSVQGQSFPPPQESTTPQSISPPVTSPQVVQPSTQPESNLSITSALQKWPCRRCTYENWPKNQSCVMCHMNREPPNDAPLSTAGEAASSNLDYSQPVSEVIPTSSSAANEENWRRIKAHVSKKDWLWLNACRGAVEGDLGAVDVYLANGGSINRKMTKTDCRLLNRPHVYEVGMTLARLAIKFQREDLIHLFVSSLEKSAALSCSPRKRMPCHVSPDLATDIRRHFALNLRQRKGEFACFFGMEHNTFALPVEIESLPEDVQELLYNELIDADVQKELEFDAKAINWWNLNAGAGSRLLALWNRTAGDCLLDSVLQATWGILDRDNTLRTAMADSLRDGQTSFFSRWREYEAAQALAYEYSLDEYQWQRDWDSLLNTASQPGESLEQLHIFTLCHILRRPIIVYGVKYINNSRSEPIGIANFQGVYLPLLWERPFCSKTPIVLGYTRGHFSALVPQETSGSVCRGGAVALTNDEAELNTIFLPLMDMEGKLLPLHFITAEESHRQEALMRDWLDCCQTRRGLLMARMRLTRRHPLVGQMLDDWLDHYRQMVLFSSAGEDHLLIQPQDYRQNWMHHQMPCNPPTPSTTPPLSSTSPTGSLRPPRSKGGVQGSSHSTLSHHVLSQRPPSPPSDNSGV